MMNSTLILQPDRWPPPCSVALRWPPPTVTVYNPGEKAIFPVSSLGDR